MTITTHVLDTARGVPARRPRCEQRHLGRELAAQLRGQQITQVGVGIQAATAAAFDDSVEYGAAASGVGITEKQPVLFSKSCRADRVLDQVVVDFNRSVFKVPIAGMHGNHPI